MVGEETSDEERAELRETLGLMDPIHVQFSRFIVNASKGEFGISYQLRRPVSELIVERLPATIELVVISALIALSPETVKNPVVQKPKSTTSLFQKKVIFLKLPQTNI